MVRRMVNKFKSDGGRLRLGKTVEKINVKNGKAVSVSFSDGETVPCDYVICACDTSVTFGSLLPPRSYG